MQKPNKRETLAEILAWNLNFFMSREKSLYRTANALGVAAGVSANTVRNLLDPKKRTVTTKKSEGFPQLDSVSKCAAKLNVEVWELFHPDIERSLAERRFYANAKANFQPAPEESSPAPEKSGRLSRNPALIK